MPANVACILLLDSLFSSGTRPAFSLLIAASVPYPLRFHPSLLDTRIGRSEIRTVYIRGLPEDIKERELNLLLRKTEGFEGAYIKYGGPRVIAWANFATQALALAAIDDIHGYNFDPYTEGCVLHASLAKNNTKLKNLPGGEDYQPKRPPPPRVMERYAPYPQPARRPLPEMAPYRPPQPPQYIPQYAPAPQIPHRGPMHPRFSADPSFAEPTTTLYIRSSEVLPTEEVERLLLANRGFLRMKMGKAGTSCFAQFADANSAAAALRRLAGQPVGTDPAGLGVEFAKSSMRCTY